nr:MAG: ORF1a [Astroviridae sp.]
MSAPWWQKSLILQLPRLCPPMATGGEPQGATTPEKQPLVEKVSSLESIPSPTQIRPAIAVLADVEEQKRLKMKASKLQAKISELQKKALLKQVGSSPLFSSSEDEEEVFTPPTVRIGTSEMKVYDKHSLPVTAADKGKAMLTGEGSSVDPTQLLTNKSGDFASRLRPNQDCTAGVGNFHDVSLHADKDGPISVVNAGARPRVQVTVSADASKWPVDNGAVHNLVDAITTLSEGSPTRRPLVERSERSRTQRFLGLLSRSKWCSYLGWLLLLVALCLGICLGGFLIYISAQYTYIASLYGPYTTKLQHAEAEVKFCQDSLEVLNSSLENTTFILQEKEDLYSALERNFSALYQGHKMLQQVLEANSKNVPVSDQALIEAEQKIMKLNGQVQSLQAAVSVYKQLDSSMKILHVDFVWWHWLVWFFTCLLMFILRPTVETAIHMISLFLTQGKLALFMWTHVLGGWSSFIVLEPLWWIPQLCLLAIFATWMAYKGRWWYLAWNVLLSIGFNALAYYLREWGIYVSSGMIHASVMHLVFWLFPIFLKLGLWSQGDLITTHKWSGERSTRNSQTWLQRLLWRSHSDIPPNPQRREQPHDKKVKFVKGETLFKPEADYGQPWVSDAVQKKITPFDVLHPQSGEIYGKAFHMSGLLVTPQHVFEAIGKPPVVTVVFDGTTYSTKKVGDLRFSGESMAAFQPVQGFKSLQSSKMKGVVISCMRSRNGTMEWGLTTGFTNTNASTHSCTTQSGDSGAPVCDQYGKLLGIHVGAAPGANLMAQKIQPESRLIICVDCECGCDDGDECNCNQNVGYAEKVKKPELIQPEAGVLLNDPCVKSSCRGYEICFDYSKSPADCKVKPGQVDLCYQCTDQATNEWQKQFSCSANKCNWVDDPCVVCNCDAAIREIMMTRTEDRDEWLQLMQEKGPAGAFKALKNKKKKRDGPGRIPRRMFTDEEYEELLAMGLSPQEIRKLARERYEFLVDRGHGSNLGAEFDPNQHLVIGKQGLQTRYTGQTWPDPRGYQESKAPPKNSQSSPGPSGQGNGEKNSKESLRQIQKSDTAGATQESVPPIKETQEQDIKPQDKNETFSELTMEAVISILEEEYAATPELMLQGNNAPAYKDVHAVAKRLDMLAEMIQKAKHMIKRNKDGKKPLWTDAGKDGKPYMTQAGKELKQLYQNTHKR